MGQAAQGYPNVFLRAGTNNFSTPPSLADLVAAMAVLMRVGLVVVEGISRDAVTRTEGRISCRGCDFIRGEEGDGTRLYWPGSAESGVTVGPGYDMGGRSAQTIIADLTAVGLPPGAAITASIGAGATGTLAGAFADAHQDTVILSLEQQGRLLDRIKPHYEQLVRDKLPRSLVSRLFQHEFDAVASLAWNTSHFGNYACNMDMNRLDLVRAATDWMTLTNHGVAGLMDRRMRETAMFTKAIYMTKPVVPPNDILMRPTKKNPSPFSIPAPANVPADGGERV